MQPLARIVVETNSKPCAAVIWLHGLGANGHDFADIVPMLGLRSELKVRFVFPHAPCIPVTVNNGMSMPAWYDIASSKIDTEYDSSGIECSVKHMQVLIAEQVEQGIPYQNIVLCGFSQGGAIALYTALKYPHKLAGAIGIACYIPLQKVIEKLDANTIETRKFLLTHGTTDNIVPIGMAESSKGLLQKLGIRPHWKTYTLSHSVNRQQIRDIGEWIGNILV